MIIVGRTSRHPARWQFAPVEGPGDFRGRHDVTFLADSMSRLQKNRRRWLRRLVVFVFLNLLLFTSPARAG